MFGAGRLLRELHMHFHENYNLPLTRTVQINATLHLQSAPAYPLRGHMISYRYHSPSIHPSIYLSTYVSIYLCICTCALTVSRSISNSYDGWTLQQMEQYIRDLVVFGTNQIEVVGPGTPFLPPSYVIATFFIPASCLHSHTYLHHMCSSYLRHTCIMC
jgi:hypothetical protein